MYCCSSKGSFKLCPIRDLSQGDKCTGQAGANIGTHHHRYSSFNLQYWQNKSIMKSNLLIWHWLDEHLLPLETIETITDVQVEELWTSTVKRIPIIRLTIGFDSNGFPWNIVPRGEKKIVCKNAFFTVLWLHSLYRLYSLCCLKRFFKLKESSINYFDILPYLELK